MLKDLTIREEYFDWLYKQVNQTKESFKTLCHILHQKEFRWSVSNDDNRCQDGLDLRQAFIDEKCLDEAHTEVIYFLKGGCTVLEVLVGVSQRLDFLNTDMESSAPRTSKWFHRLLTNLRLNIFRDGSNLLYNRTYDYRKDDVLIDTIIDRMMDRTYDSYGNGSLFPMKRQPPQDMRKTEIWYQMMYWQDENYGLG